MSGCVALELELHFVCSHNPAHQDLKGNWPRFSVPRPSKAHLITSPGVLLRPLKTWAKNQELTKTHRTQMFHGNPWKAYLDLYTQNPIDLCFDRKRPHFEWLVVIQTSIYLSIYLCIYIYI